MNMVRAVRNRILYLAILFFVGLLSVHGCAATKKIKNDIFGGDSHLKKKIAFFKGKNLSGRGSQQLGTVVSTSVKSHLENNCQGLIIIDSNKTRQALEGIAPLPSGHRDSFALAQAGRALGLNGVVETTLQDIWFTSEKRGIWGFRDDVPLMKVTLGISVYDIETTATVLNEVFQEEIDLPEGPYPESTEITERNEELIKAAIAQVISKIGDQVCEGLSDIPWKGYIVGEKGDTDVVSAGEDVGLKVGDTWEVVKMADPVEGLDGEIFLLPGPKIGEVVVTEVHAKKALATAVFGNNLQNSCSVKLKDGD